MDDQRPRSRTPLERRRHLASDALTNLVLRGSPNGSAKHEKHQQPNGRTHTTKERKEVGKVEKKADVPLAKSVALSLVDLGFVLSLVFGGCCSNMWTYEYLLQMDHQMGTALTFSQMLFVTLHSLPSFLTYERKNFIPRIGLKPRQVPITQWALQVFVLTAGNLLTTWAFAFQVPATIQIVFRSAGLVVSMLFGRLFLDKRYSFPQISSILLVSVGVVLATLSRPAPAKSQVAADDLTDYTIGIGMLTLSLIFTGALGTLQEIAYTKYGPCWKEGIFYTHFLALPVFLPMIPHVSYGFRSLSVASSRFANPSSSEVADHTAFAPLLSLLPETLVPFAPYVLLGGNLITQLVCVSGVNQLSSRVSSVSTNIVLTTRKAISLCFSVWWFGNGWNAELGFGASMVFMGSLLYTLVSSPNSSSTEGKKKEE